MPDWFAPLLQFAPVYAWFFLGLGLPWALVLLPRADWADRLLVITLALALADPDNGLLPDAVRWLMIARQGDHWVTTQETAWSVLALTEWMQITGELQGSYTYTARLNAETVLDATAAPT
ncbi:MAG: hypothetical protein HC915_12400, partial [Anaerolineae bacterium]|nr:hypothetical protein [Anaerolineae bacterium]